MAANREQLLKDLHDQLNQIQPFEGWKEQKPLFTRTHDTAEFSRMRESVDKVKLVIQDLLDQYPTISTG